MRSSRLMPVAAVLTMCLAAVPAAADRGKARAGREARREEIQDKRDEKRDAREDKRDDKRNALKAKKKGADPGVNKRQRRQGSRIVGGVKSGQLTQAEVEGLTAQEAALRDLEAGMKADGQLTHDERETLHSELSALSKSIRSEKHDADRTAPLRVRDGSDNKAAAEKARRLAQVRRELNSATPTPAQRAALETEHAAIIDDLYEESFDDD